MNALKLHLIVVHVPYDAPRCVMSRAMKGYGSFTVVASLSFLSLAVDAQDLSPLPCLPPPPAPPPLPPRFEQEYSQRLALLLFYHLTSGPYWINRVGWQDATLDNSTEMVKHNCSLVRGSTTRFPDYCCWSGVKCCQFEMCNSTGDTTL